MSNITFYTVGIAITSGIFIRSFFDIGFAGIGLLFLIGCACIFAWRYTAQTSGTHSPLFLIGIATLFLACGMVRLHVSLTSPSPLLEYSGEKVVLTGHIAREPDFREANIQLYVRPENTEELVLVTVDKFINEPLNLSHGDLVRVEGVLEKPEAFASDGGRTFDYPGYLKARGVETTISFAEIEMVTQEQGTFFGYLFLNKKRFQNIIEEIIPAPYAGLGEGLLLGVKRALPKSLETTFRETGIIHIVVLSGYNIMIVVEFFMFVLSFIFFPRARLIIGSCAVILFALLVGLSATVVRASVMAILLLIARTTGRIYAVLRALMFAGVMMLLWNPYLLVHDPGFQLSFLATLGLILVAPWIETYFTKIPKMLGVRGFLTATISTQLFVLPLLLYHMGLFSMVAVIVNVLVLPMVPAAMLLTFATGVVGAVSIPVGFGIGFLAHLSLAYIVTVAKIFGALSFASFSIPAFPFWVVLVTYSIFGIVLAHIYTEKKQKEITNTENVVTEGWIIEEEVDAIRTTPEAQSASGVVKLKFPIQ